MHVHSTNKCNYTLKDKILQLLYECEVRLLKLADKKKISTFEVWLWHRIIRVSWAEHQPVTSLCISEIRWGCLCTKDYWPRQRNARSRGRPIYTEQKKLSNKTIVGPHRTNNKLSPNRVQLYIAASSRLFGPSTKHSQKFHEEYGLCDGHN